MGSVSADRRRVESKAIRAAPLRFSDAGNGSGKDGSVSEAAVRHV